MSNAKRLCKITAKSWMIFMHDCNNNRYLFFLQILMNVMQTTVLRSAPTLLAPSPVPATVDSHWQLMDDPALVSVEADSLQPVAVSSLLGGLTGTHTRTSSANGSLNYPAVHQELRSLSTTQHSVSMDELPVLMTTFSSLMELPAMPTLF